MTLSPSIGPLHTIHPSFKGDCTHTISHIGKLEIPCFGRVGPSLSCRLDSPSLTSPEPHLICFFPAITCPYRFNSLRPPTHLKSLPNSNQTNHYPQPKHRHLRYIHLMNTLVGLAHQSSHHFSCFCSEGRTCVFFLDYKEEFTKEMRDE